MAAGDQLVIRATPAGPLNAGYTTSASQSIEVTSGVATLDGTSAAGGFQPALGFYDPNGVLLSRAVASETIAAGSSAEVSFFPFVQASSSTGPAASLSVTDGLTTVLAVTEIDFTSGATVSSGGAGIADVAVTGTGGYTPGARCAKYQATAVLSATDATAHMSWTNPLGETLLNLTTPTQPAVITRGVYSCVVSYAGFGGPAAWSDGAVLEAHLFASPNGAKCEAWDDSVVGGQRLNAPKGCLTVVTPMIAGDFFSLDLFNRDLAGDQFVGVNDIVVTLIAKT